MSGRTAERKVSGPLVLAIASAMLSAGAAGIWLSTRPPEPTEEVEAPVIPPFDSSAAEEVAETFLDAWRKRDHRVARTIAEGPALLEINERAEADGELSEEELETKTQIWDRIAERLTFEVGTREQDGSELLLSGTARGTFMGAPYAREIQFLLVETSDGFRVREMDLGEILTESADFLDLPPE